MRGWERVLERGDDGEEGVDASHLQQRSDTRRWRNEDESGAVALAAAVEVDDFAEARGVHEGNAGEFEDGEVGVILAELGTEGAEIAEDERAAQLKYPAARFGEVGELDMKRFRWHPIGGTAGFWICVDSIGKPDAKCRGFHAMSIPKVVLH